jgi:hypothetical protein
VIQAWGGITPRPRAKLSWEMGRDEQRVLELLDLGETDFSGSNLSKLEGLGKHTGFSWISWETMECDLG